MIVDLITITIGDYCVSLISLFSLIGGFDMEYSHGTSTIAVADNKEHWLLSTHMPHGTSTIAVADNKEHPSITTSLLHGR